MVTSLAQQHSAPYRYDTDPLPDSFFVRNRKALLDRIPDSSVAVFFSAPVRNRSNDVDYDYHQDPDFYYLTGFDAPDALLFLFKPAIKGIDGQPVTERLAIHARDASSERWTGRMATPEEVAVSSGIHEVVLTSETGIFKDAFQVGCRVLTKRLPQGVVNDRQDEADLFDLLQEFKEKSTESGAKTDDYILGKKMALLREIKSEEELVLLRKAVQISVDGHLEMMRTVSPGMHEYSAEATGEFVFHNLGAEAVGYPSICGSEANSVVLHYDKNRRKLQDGELLLLDMGAEYHGYTADITRTIPVSGRFNPQQRAVYELVLAAQQAGIEACKVGNRFRQPHEAAFEVIEKGLLKLGITRSEKETKDYFPHGTSHYLGLDVHDAGSFEPLKAFQVITVEPGIYIPAGSPCDPKWWNIGIRIEDDVLITPDGPDVLSDRLPKTPEGIESVMNAKK
jgi:Xaa-Pro aminopeptidase